MYNLQQECRNVLQGYRDSKVYCKGEGLVEVYNRGYYLNSVDIRLGYCVQVRKGWLSHGWMG